MGTRPHAYAVDQHQKEANFNPIQFELGLACFGDFLFFPACRSSCFRTAQVGLLPMKGPEEREQPSACSAEWLVEKSRQSLDLGDQFAAKSWLLTAKTLFPRAFAVQVNLRRVSRIL